MRADRMRNLKTFIHAAVRNERVAGKSWGRGPGLCARYVMVAARPDRELLTAARHLGGTVGIPSIFALTLLILALFVVVIVLLALRALTVGCPLAVNGRRLLYSIIVLVVKLAVLLSLVLALLHPLPLSSTSLLQLPLLAVLDLILTDESLGRMSKDVLILAEVADPNILGFGGMPSVLFLLFLTACSGSGQVLGGSVAASGLGIGNRSCMGVAC